MLARWNSLVHWKTICELLEPSLHRESKVVVVFRYRENIKYNAQYAFRSNMIKSWLIL